MPELRKIHSNRKRPADFVFGEDCSAVAEPYKNLGIILIDQFDTVGQVLNGYSKRNIGLVIFVKHLQ